MADTMQFDLVAPERMVHSASATAVTIPAAEGDMTAMPGHAPLIATLRPGVVTVMTDGKSEEFVVTGGFAEVSATAAALLAEEAMPKSEVTADFLNEKIAHAEKLVGGAEPGPQAALLGQQLNDFMGLKSRLGL
ncbi:MAG: ATP synthase F1 subunit epsilon [Neomegalonema sp.]